MASDPQNSENASTPSPATRDWRDADRFTQGERISGEAPRPDPSDQPADLRRAFWAGGAMVATTLVLSLLGLGGVVGFVAGLIVFGAVLYTTSPRRRAAQAQRRVAEARLEAVPEPVREALARAEADLSVIDDVAARLRADSLRPGDAEIARALEGVTAAARDVRQSVLADPNDYDRARAFFRVLCPSMRAASEKFVALPARDDAIDARFKALAADMTAASARQRETLLADERIDLEVEIDVLADRIRGAG